MFSAEISIHALREESDHQVNYSIGGYNYISIHALREESDREANTVTRDECISIHALREESDLGGERMALQTLAISIHALREESDLARC